MIRRYSIVIDPTQASPLYIGGDAEEAKSIVKTRKAAGQGVAAWINVRPEKRFMPGPVKAKAKPAPAPAPKPAPAPEPEAEHDIEAIKQLAAGDGRKQDVKDARAKLDEMGIER